MLKTDGRRAPFQVNENPTGLLRVAKCAGQTGIDCCRGRSAGHDEGRNQREQNEPCRLERHDLSAYSTSRVDDRGRVPYTIEPVDSQKQLNSLSVFTVIVLLATVTMTFGALIAVFLIRSNSPMFWGHIRLPRTLWITTVLLLASSATYEAARRQLSKNNQQEFFQLTAWTAGLGTLFLAGQIVAWFQVLHQGITLAHNPHSWFIFLFHRIAWPAHCGRTGRTLLSFKANP